MSDFGDLETAILNVVSTAIPGIDTKQGLIAFDSLSKYPVAMTYDPVENTTTLEGRQEQRTTVVNLVVVTNRETAEALSLKIDAIRDGIVADPTLGGVVRHSFVSQRAREEFLGGTSERIAGVLQITAEKIA